MKREPVGQLLSWNGKYLTRIFGPSHNPCTLGWNRIEQGKERIS